MTFEQLLKKLIICIRVQDESRAKKIYDLEVKFKEINEMEYAFWLAKEKDPDDRFNIDICNIIDQYNELPESAKKRAYIYAKFDMIDTPRLYLDS